MTEAKNSHLDELRTKAERLLSEDPKLAAHPSAPDLERLLHELHVHQVKLELQNEELRSAQERLQALSKEYFDLYSLSPVGYVMLSSTGAILKANLAGARLLGIEGRHTTQFFFSAFVDSQEADRYYDHLTSTWSAGQQRDLECGMRSMSGRKFFARLQTIPLPDEKDKVSRLLTAVTDITELKEAENVLKHHRDVLGKEVQKQTADLETAMGQLKDTNQELQDFAYAASHDLQEPLRKIQTFGGLLAEQLEGRLNDVERDYLARMTHAADRMQEMIRSLLEYSRVATAVESLEPVRLKESVGDALQVLSEAVKRTGAVVQVADLPTVRAKPEQMVRLFQNLIENAIKFCNGKPKIDVYAEATPESHKVFVVDNGIGFEEKYAERIFAPFERLHGRSEYEGTGIGLATARRIVERHGGTIIARSQPGKGTTFVITLPREE